MIERLVDIEKEWFLWLNSPHNHYLDSVMYMISDKYPWIAVAVAFFFIMLYKQRPKECVIVVLALLLLILIGDQMSSHIIKPLIQRYRPTHHPVTAHEVKTVLGYMGGNYGFISGHSTNFIAFATFTTLLVRRKEYGFTAFIVALTVCYSRIYLGVHFITDVIPGIIVGLLIGKLVFEFYVSARRLYLGYDHHSARIPYFKPHTRGLALAYLLAGFYIAIWTISPFLIRFYSYH